MVLLAEHWRTVLVHSSGTDFIVEGVACLHHANRVGGTLLQRLGEGSHRPVDGVSAVPGPILWAVVSWP